MLIIPAIDLKNGQAVRLYKGDYKQKTVYSEHPETLAVTFEQLGASFLHLVDLDGAKTGIVSNDNVIKKIKTLTHLKIQVGGGIRTLETIDYYLNQLGVDRVILGTAAVVDPDFLDAALVRFGPEKIVVGVDIKEGNIATKGWLDTSSHPYLEFLSDLEKRGLTTVVITDVSKDGTLLGPNFEWYDQIKAHTALKIIVSGGIKDQADLDEAALRKYEGVIVGKAYYEGKIDLKEAFLRC